MRRTLIVLTAGPLALLGACGSGDDGSGAGDTTTTTPAATTTATPAASTTAAARPERIVSISPTATEMLFAIGAGEQVVAVDDQSTYPPEAPRTSLSGFTPNVEAIVGYDPDLVVLSGDAGDVLAGLKAAGVATLVQPAAAVLDDTYAQIEQLGAATGHVGDAAELVARMQSDIDALVAEVAKPATPFTYYHELDDQYYTATSKTFIGNIYGLAGLENIGDAADKDGSGYPQLSAEYILQQDPDLVFLADTNCCGQNAETVAARPGWDQLAAVKNGGVIPVDDDIASRWGPRVVDFLEIVVDATAKVPAGS
jgi:iron complex transport system substrate-binding protein